MASTKTKPKPATAADVTVQRAKAAAAKAAGNKKTQANPKNPNSPAYVAAQNRRSEVRDRAMKGGRSATESDITKTMARNALVRKDPAWREKKAIAERAIAAGKKKVTASAVEATYRKNQAKLAASAAAAAAVPAALPNEMTPGSAVPHTEQMQGLNALTRIGARLAGGPRPATGRTPGQPPEAGGGRPTWAGTRKRRRGGAAGAGTGPATGGG